MNGDKMNPNNVGNILDKINELRALFIFGQRVIPFLEELFYFVHDIIPVLEEINVSIYESANKMPRASSQLDKVTQATELATTEILDSLDGVLNKLNSIDSHFDTATADLDAIGKLDAMFLEKVSNIIGPDRKDDIKQLTEIYDRKKDHLKAVKANADGLEKSLKDIRAKSNDIMISLQVQDITAQQIASVNHLIESVQGRLSSLIDRFKINGADLVSEIEKMEKHTFDPEASYDRSGNLQRSADEVVHHVNSMNASRGDGKKKTVTNPTSQDEIDKMFGNGA